MADPVSTWFQTPAFATRFIKPKTLDELKAIDLESMPYFCIGAGSNTLIRDGGFEGTIIKLVGDFTKITIEENEMTVGAGCLNRMAVHRALEHHLSGLEFLIGIPYPISSQSNRFNTLPCALLVRRVFKRRASCASLYGLCIMSVLQIMMDDGFDFKRTFSR